MEQENLLRKRVKALFDAGMRDDRLAINLAQTIAVYHAEKLASDLRIVPGSWQQLALHSQVNPLAQMFLNLAPLFFIGGIDLTARRENIEHVLDRYWNRTETIGGTSCIIHQELETITAFLIFAAPKRAEARLTKLEEGLYARFDLELRWKRAAAEITELLTEKEEAQ